MLFGIEAETNYFRLEETNRVASKFCSSARLAIMMAESNEDPTCNSGFKAQNPRDSAGVDAGNPVSLKGWSGQIDLSDFGRQTPPDRKRAERLIG